MIAGLRAAGPGHGGGLAHERGVGRALGGVLCRQARCRAVAFHARCEPEEMMVVRHVAERIDTAGIASAQGQIRVIRRYRDLVGGGRVVPATDA